MGVSLMVRLVSPRNSCTRGGEGRGGPEWRLRGGGQLKIQPRSICSCHATRTSKPCPVPEECSVHGCKGPLHSPSPRRDEGKGHRPHHAPGSAPPPHCSPGGCSGCGSLCAAPRPPSQTPAGARVWAPLACSFHESCDPMGYGTQLRLRPLTSKEMLAAKLQDPWMNQTLAHG